MLSKGLIDIKFWFLSNIFIRRKNKQAKNHGSKPLKAALTSNWTTDFF